jgi:hypothetical protein
MCSKRPALFKIIYFATVFLLLFSGTLACGSKPGNPVSTGNIVKLVSYTPLTVLSFVMDNVLILKAGGKDWDKGEEGAVLEADDKIKTDAGGQATVTFFDGSTIDLNSNTEVSLDELTSKSSSFPKIIKLTQKIGETTSRIVKLTDPASRYDVETQAGVAAVRGSTMVVQVTDDGTTKTYNVEGTITLTAQGKEVSIPVGSNSTAQPGEVPGAPQPGLPPGIRAAGSNSFSSQKGWQQSELQLNSGDSFYVEYRGGGWSVDYRNFPHVGPAGYSADINKTIAAGYQLDSTLPYGFLLGKVGDGKVIPIGGQGGPFTADASGFLFLRINDGDSSLRDNDGAITVTLRCSTANSPVVKGSLRQNPPDWNAPAATEASAGNAAIQADGTVNVSLTAGAPGTTYGVYLEEYKGITGGAENYLSWKLLGSLTTDSNGMCIFSGTYSLSAGTHYLQIVLSVGGGWGPSAYGTNISKIIIN